MRNPPVDDPPYEDTDPQVDRIHSAIADIDSYRGDSYRSGSDSHYAEPDYAEPDYAPVEEAHDAGHAYDAGRHYDTGHHYDDAGDHGHQQQYFEGGEESAYAEAPTAQPQAHDEPNYFFDGEAPPADERFYDDPPRTRHGNGLVTAAVLIGCALLGTAGAYGYRSYYAGARSTDAPIISADPTPSKMVPSTASVVPGQQQAADKGPGEQVVTHQEEPVTLAAPAPAPRVVLPAPYPVPSAKQPAPPTSTAAIPSAAPVPVNGGPDGRKVRTVTIKPDGSDFGTQPLATTTPTTQATLAAPPAPARPAPRTAQPRSNGGPLSLEPRAQDSQPAPAAPAPKLASVSGGYVVQISSQTSEAEAHTSFRTLQAKYPHELGDREALIQRADTPSGVRYRAAVGPFASMADAQQFCSRYKAAGGDCFAHKN